MSMKQPAYKAPKNNAPHIHSSIGRLVRLNGLSILHQLAFAESTPPKTADIYDFSKNIIAEAVPFIDDVAPKSGAASTHWTPKGAAKTFDNSSSPVDSFKRIVKASDIHQLAAEDQYLRVSGDESWFCRRSCHVDSKAPRTASWDEFVHAFRDAHPETEMAFTPDVVGADVVSLALPAVLSKLKTSHGNWHVDSIKFVEMTHNLPHVTNRVFPVLQFAATLLDDTQLEEFMVVSIPINDYEHSQYSTAVKKEGVVVASYVAVERVRKMPDGQIEWLMATASNVKGMIPQLFTNMGTSANIPKDVDMYLKWQSEQRTR